MILPVLSRHIEATADVCGGRPRIVGRRITVEHVAVWHERVGMSPEEIASEYSLSLGDVYAALAYYHDHREEIDRRMEEGKAFAEAMKAEAPSVLRERLEGERQGAADAPPGDATPPPPRPPETPLG